MRLLGVDLGQKRIGLALAESERGIATPLPPLAASGVLKNDAEKIVNLAKRERVDLCVVGFPAGDSQSDGGRMQRATRLLRDCIEAIGMKAKLQDESLTSVLAEDDLRAMGMTGAQRRKHKDGESAARILLRFIDEAGGAGETP